MRHRGRLGLAPQGIDSIPNVWPAPCVSLKTIAGYGLAAFQGTATRASLGDSSLSSSRRFPPRSDVIRLAHARDVTAGSREISDKPAPQRIARCHDDRDGRGGTLRREWRERSTCHNDINLESD